MDINKENLIEGIGDEVLIVISVLLITFIVFLLWLSKDLHCLPAYIRRILNQHQSDTIVNETENNESLEHTYDEGDTDDNDTAKIDDIPTIPVECNLRSSGDAVNKPSDDIQANNCNSFELPAGFITLTMKYLDERTSVINVDPQTTVLDFKRNHFKEELNNNKSVRLIYNGRELKELKGEATLAGYGLIHKSTVHCLVTTRRDNNDQSHSSLNEGSGSGIDINLGNLMFPLLGFVLSLLWYYRLNYKYHFNMMTTFALIGITGMYFIACFVNYSAPVINYREPVRQTAENVSI